MPASFKSYRSQSVELKQSTSRCERFSKVAVLLTNTILKNVFCG